jgi:hypothetical protein
MLPQKVYGAQKAKVKVNVCNLSDKMKILDLLKSLVEVGRLYGKSELSICSISLKSIHPE